MSSTITVPTAASLGGFATEVATNLAATGGTLTLTVGYGVPAASVTAGAILTAAAVVIARVAAGTIDTANDSTVRFIATNW